MKIVYSTIFITMTGNWTRHKPIAKRVELILQPFRHFTYVTSHSPTLPSLYLRHSSFFQPFRCFTYITDHSPTVPSLLLRHRLFTYVTWRAANDYNIIDLLNCESQSSKNSLMNSSGNVERWRRRHNTQEVNLWH